MRRQKNYSAALIEICILVVVGSGAALVYAQQGKIVSSYGPTNQDVSFDQIKAARMAVKATRAKEHMEMLNSRYSLAKKTSADVLMSGGKPIPVGPTANLRGVAWEQLNTMSAEQIREKGVFPYKPLPCA